MSRPKNAQPTGLATSSLPNQLPASLTVPPLPPRVHRRLLASASDDGVVLRPGDSKDPAVLIRWGLRGKVEEVNAAENDDEVELGGVLGIVRLWDCKSDKALADCSRILAYLSASRQVANEDIP